MKIPTYITTIICSVLLLACEETPQEMTKEEPKSVEKLTAYIGTYTRTEGHVDGKADGIYRVSIDTTTGEILSKETVAAIINPSFVKLSKDRTHLYAVSELARKGEPTGFLYNYKITPDSLQIIDRLPTDHKAPCHIGLDQSGKYVFVNNYVGGIMKVYKRNEDASLTEIV